MKASISADRDFMVGKVDDRLFGSFVEHLGRAVYGGIYEPGHPQADKKGFRKDVLALVRKLNLPLVRYPGGNYVSSFNWEDSVGPAAERKARLDPAWRTLEPNSFGLAEFIAWTKAAGTAPMMALNLGTRGVDEARSLAEYCNHPGGTYWSDLRRLHGSSEPFGVKLWCLGNEMDGPWQLGQKTADAYGTLAAETGKALKLFDPSLELIACGSSFPDMPTFPDWDATVLSHCYDTVDYLSLHSYYGDGGHNLPEFLASSIGMDNFIRTAVSACDFVKAKKRSGKVMNISFDEWNVWYRTSSSDRMVAPWHEAPHLLEEIYTFADALVVGTLLITLLRHADRVKIACVAQLVNVLAPIMTENGGKAWCQTIFWPFYQASRFGRGTVLDCRISSPEYASGKYGEVPYLEAVLVLADDGCLTLFAVNRSASEDLEVEIKLAGLTATRIIDYSAFRSDNPDAVNSSAKPETVIPRLEEGKASIEDGQVSLLLAPLSWNVVRISTGI